jgi:predicted ATPase
MLARDCDRYFVITGSPGSGKSTLIAALKSSGFAVCEEAGRAIIKQQMASDGRALPWIDPGQFADAMLMRDLQTYQAAAQHGGAVFFDRGIPDVLGYLNLMNLPVSDEMREAAHRHRYNRTVFIAPFWAEIFVQDEERKQTPEEAERTCEAMVRIYGEYGYDLVALPRASTAERVAFVRAMIAT